MNEEEAVKLGLMFHVHELMLKGRGHGIRGEAQFLPRQLRPCHEDGVDTRMADNDTSILHHYFLS